MAGPPRELGVFSEADARRIVRAVRQWENMPPGGPRRPRPRERPASREPPLWGEVTADWPEDPAKPNEVPLYLCGQNGANAIRAREILCYRMWPADAEPGDVDLSEGDVVPFLPFWDVDAQKPRGLLVGLGAVGTFAAPYVMLPIAANRVSELTAQVDTWDRDNQPAGKDGVQWHGPRIVYDTTDKKFFLFDRIATHDSLGGLASYGSETKREVIDLVNCTTV